MIGYINGRNFKMEYWNNGTMNSSSNTPFFPAYRQASFHSKKLFKV